jgi:SnoaL-like domain
MATTDLDAFYRGYITRVVNDHDMTAVDEMVSPGYTGGGYGWAQNIEELREFYDRQNRTRPDWRIDIQETLQVGEWIAVRAIAGGVEAYNDDGSPKSPPYMTSVEWLAVVHVIDRMIVEGRLISVVDHSGDE